MAKMILDTKKIRRGFALVIVNENFECHADRIGAKKDHDNIMEFCKNAKFTVNDIDALKLKDTSDLEFDSKGLKTRDLTAKQMEDLFKAISKGEFSSFDAFVCFISSHGSHGGILGIDGKVVALQAMIDYVKASPENRSLVGKPKLFFTQNCRGIKYCMGVAEEPDDVVADDGCVPLAIPREADILIFYSTVDEYESYRSKKEGSWFITELTKVLNRCGHNLDLTNMLTIVNNEMARKISKQGKKQMPCFLTTLRKAFYFDIPKPSESPALSSQEPPIDLSVE